MTKPSRPAIAVLVLLLASPGLAAAGYLPIATDSGEVSSRSLVMVAPAVGERPDGSLVGVAMSMQVTVRDGSGGVYVDTRPLTQVDMQGSARLAASLASAIAGSNMAAHDHFITVRAQVPTVGGPSAGAAITVGFLALLLDVPVRDDVVMTGMINPDGSIGPIGGVLEKAEAAHDHGATLFLIPEGQSIVRTTVRETQGDGWFPTVVERVEEVDVAERARAWGLEVREVADVYAAFEAATGQTIKRPIAEELPRPDAYDTLMAEAAATQLGEALTTATRLRAAVNEAGFADEFPGTQAQLDAFLDAVELKLARAEAALANGSPYAASSLVFQSNVELRKVALWLATLATDDQRAFLSGYGQGESARLATVKDEAVAADADSVSTLEALGAAEVRVLEAERLLSDAEAALSDDRLVDALSALAFAAERRRSVSWWLNLTAALAEVDGGGALSADPAGLAADYAGIAQQAIAYAEALVVQTGASAGLARLLADATAALTDAQAASDAGLDVGALYLALEAQVGAHAALSLLGAEDRVADRMERQRAHAVVAIAAARRLGAEPFLAASYLDFADELAAGDPVNALLMYGNAASIAATSTGLASGEPCGFAAVPCGGPPPAVARVRVPGPDPWTAYFALASVVLGFMGGILVTLVVHQAREARQRNGAGANLRARTGNGAPYPHVAVPAPPLLLPPARPSVTPLLRPRRPRRRGVHAVALRSDR